VGPTEKDRKIAKIDQKIALLSLFQRGASEKRPKSSKKGRKIALLFTMFVSCMKIQGGPCPPLPTPMPTLYTGRY